MRFVVHAGVLGVGSRHQPPRVQVVIMSLVDSSATASLRIASSSEALGLPPGDALAFALRLGFDVAPERIDSRLGRRFA